MWLSAQMVLALLAGTAAVAPVSGPWPSDTAEVSDLPLVVNPRSRAAAGPTLAVILSGDGGWAAGDKTMASAFVRQGVAVVGLDIPSYLRIKRTPDEVGELTSPGCCGTTSARGTRAESSWSGTPTARTSHRSWPRAFPRTSAAGST